MIATPEMIAAAWKAFRRDRPAALLQLSLVEALNAALALVPDTLAAEREAGRREGLEEAARLIETTKEGYGPSGKYLVARIEGDTMGSAYAVGILALRDTPAAPVEGGAANG